MTSPNVTLDRPDEAQIRKIARTDFVLTQTPWAFAQEKRAEIDAHFETLKLAKPSLWNGRVLLFRNCRFSGDALQGEAFETDYASFSAWHAWGRPDGEQTKNVFALPAIEGSDGRFLLGEMGAHTANAGHIYFPCGTPDLDDVAQGHVDLDLSARRELLEETGLDAATLTAEPGWTVVELGPFVALYKRMRATEAAEALRERILGFLKSQAQPELSDIVIVRQSSDIVPAMPPFIAAFLADALSSRVRS